MAYKNVRVLIRVDYSPISDTKSFSDKLRTIDGFGDVFDNYNYFRIGDTSNYRNGTVKDMEPDELVYRYWRKADGVEYVLDFSSHFFYIRLSGETIPADLSNYFRIVEEATRIVTEGDSFVRIATYGAGKEFEDKYPEEKEDYVDKVERDAYTSQPESVRIICQRKEQKDATRYTIVAFVNDVKKNPDYKRGEKLYDVSFMNALTKAEQKYAELYGR